MIGLIQNDIIVLYRAPLRVCDGTFFQTFDEATSCCDVNPKYALPGYKFTFPF
jgi:hypothetical protein